MSIRDLLRPWVHRFRAFRDSRLHPMRRRRAIRALRTLPPAPDILVLCLGNICRSPYAAYRIATGGKGRTGEVQSAGFIGPDRSSPHEAIDEGARRGIDLLPHRSRIADSERDASHHLVIVMERGQIDRFRSTAGRTNAVFLILGDLDPEIPRSRTIPDPFGKGAAAFTFAYERIDRCVDELLRLLPGESMSRQGGTPAMD